MRYKYISFLILFLPISQLFGQNNKYAVLINSAYNKKLNEVGFYNELTRIYKYLIYDLNFSEDNIFIYSADGTDTGDDYEENWEFYNSDPDLDGDGDYDITGPSDFNSISSKLSDLDFLDGDDFLFIYLTGPVKEVFNEGSIFNPYDYYEGIAFWNSDRKNNNSLVSPMSGLTPGNLVFIDGRSCDGIDVNDYDAVNRYIIKSMTYTEGQFNIPLSTGYGRDLLDALIGEDINGNSVSADYDNSGITTIKEARIYASNQNSPDYSDTYWYDGLKASNINLNGYAGCQSIYTIIPGIVSGTENYVNCSVKIDGLVVESGGQLNIDFENNVTIENFAVDVGGTLLIK